MCGAAEELPIFVVGKKSELVAHLRCSLVSRVIGVGRLRARNNDEAHVLG